MARHSRHQQVTVTNKKSKMHLLLWANILLTLGLYAALFYTWMN